MLLFSCVAISQEMRKSCHHLATKQMCHIPPWVPLLHELRDQQKEVLRICAASPPPKKREKGVDKHKVNLERLKNLRQQLEAVHESMARRVHAADWFKTPQTSLLPEPSALRTVEQVLEFRLLNNLVLPGEAFFL